MRRKITRGSITNQTQTPISANRLQGRWAALYSVFLALHL